MTGAPAIAVICANLSALLSVQQPYFAQLASKLETAAKSDLSKAAPMYCSLDWWGGSGSMADSAGVGSSNGAKKIILKDLVALRDSFDREGVHCPRADQWTDTFRQWLADGVFDEPGA